MLTIQELQACSVFPTERERDFYLAAAYGRFCRTTWLVKGLGEPMREQFSSAPSPRLFEFGANPYFLTWMLVDEIKGCDVTMANWFGEGFGEPNANGMHSQESAGRALPFFHFNCEDIANPMWDRLGTEQYDLVLFCEILEHMLADPAPTMRKLSAMLKPTGRLILTTPNVFSRQNLVKWEKRVNPFEWYSPNGAYGRHNRLWSCSELMTIPGPHRWGLTLESMFTEDAAGSATVQDATRGVEPDRQRADGDTIFCVYHKV